MTAGSLRAVIWDMDGVIADTAEFHRAAWQEAFRKRGVQFTEELFRRTFGQRNETVIRTVLGQDVSQEEIDTIGDEKEADYRRRIERSIRALPGVSKLLASLAEKGFGQAIATSAPLENVRQILGSLGIEGCFQVIVSARDVTEGKPSPQGFLLALRRLGVHPPDCVVIEDAVAGVAAARRAGIRCLAVTNSHPRESLGEADLVLDSLEEVTVATLERLVSQGGGQV